MTNEQSVIVLPDAPEEQQLRMREGGVACWEEVVSIDTYELGEPDRFPLFLDRRVYQGSSGRVYPLPMIDRIADGKRPRAWRAIHVENAYVRLMLLPELGGRIHIAVDKVAGYDMFYRNNVIKPALVGLAGPWISGGVEFNWPQHHRPATFLPVRTRIDREPDGAVVVWHSDLDPLQRMRGMHGVRLRPESSLVEVDVLLHNRTDVAQTFLWWANVAAAIHDDYQSVFPEDVAYVADHARRAITAYPHADRPYYGVDYPALAETQSGADRIDFPVRMPVPSSYMVTDTQEEFFGGYDHRAQAGFVHWADRAISPGKKQWTWGGGDIGRAWARQLTDDDGPYVELMAGVFTDNQPDFSWLAPGETRRFSQFWYPIHRIGPARQANRHAAIAVSHTDNGVCVGLITTVERDVELTIRSQDAVIDVWRGRVGPGTPVIRRLPVMSDVCQVVVSEGAGEILSWIHRDSKAAEPWVAAIPPAPERIESIDALFVTATHLAQYRHPSRSPVPYLREALARDPRDSRAATALGAWHLSRGEYEQACHLFEIAVDRVTARNAHPRDGEPIYLLGLALERLGLRERAAHCFEKAAWNYAWRSAACLARARLALWEGAAEHAKRWALQAGDIPEARRVLVLALRRQGRQQEADATLAALIAEDPLDPSLLALVGDAEAIDPREPLDAATEFARAGAVDEALRVTTAAVASDLGFANAEPLRYYLRALWLEKAGRHGEAAAERRSARIAPSLWAFPAGLDVYDALRAALVADASDAHAHALLGMWLLDAARDVDALAHLRAAASLASSDPVTWRNLALAIVRVDGDLAEADDAMVRALQCGGGARVVYERDLLARRRGVSAVDRLAWMEQYRDILLERDDLALAYAVALLDSSRVHDAWRILTTRTFRPFEGGEGRVIAAYDRAACEIARSLLPDDPAAAEHLLREGIRVPETLGEGRHPANPPVERLVLLGDIASRRGDMDTASGAWRAATARSLLAVDERPLDEVDFWRGLAHLRLRNDALAEATWVGLERRADELESLSDEVDYFATSLPELGPFDADSSAARARQAQMLRSLARRGAALSAQTRGGAEIR